MIEKLKGFNILFDFEEKRNFYTIYSYERIILSPQSKQYISLPYKITKDTGYINFELDKNLSEKGLECVWNNLNEDNSKINLLFLFKNDNIVMDKDLNNLTSIFGTHKKIDVIPNTLLGKIYFS